MTIIFLFFCCILGSNLVIVAFVLFVVLSQLKLTMISNNKDIVVVALLLN